MFAVESGIDQRKRAREEEELANGNGSTSFGEHRNVSLLHLILSDLLLELEY
jgi:hypothetical protein